MQAVDSCISVSPNGRYFVDRAGQPLFWLGDTQWNLFRCHTLEEARTILEDRKAKGFSAIQVMLLGWAREVEAGAVHGEAFPDGDPAHPNPAYFDHVDAVVELARQLGLLLVIGMDHPAVRLTDLRTARPYARWLGERYRDAAHLLWSASYMIPNADNLPVIRELVAGLREGDGGRHLLTCHPDPAQPVVSSSGIHQAEWLAFNSIQTFNATHLLYETVLADYQLTPAKPVVMAEGAYEDGPEYGFPITPLIIRRQAYWTYLAGGHHSYGHNTNWRVPAGWRAGLDAPGARQMRVLRDLFTARRWWELVPEQAVIAEGAGSGNTLNAAARAQGGDWLMAYLSTSASIGVHMDAITTADRATATWIDPRTGALIDTETVRTRGTHRFTCPEGLEDAVLVIEAAGRQSIS